MRELGTIHTRYWSWAQENDIGNDAMIGAYFLSNEISNSLGCYPMPRVLIADDLGYPIGRLSKAYRYPIYKVLRPIQARFYSQVPQMGQIEQSQARHRYDQDCLELQSQGLNPERVFCRNSRSNIYLLAD